MKYVTLAIAVLALILSLRGCSGNIEGKTLVIKDKQGRQRFEIKTNDQGDPTVRLQTDDGKPALEISLDNGTSRIQVRDSIQIAADPDGTAVVRLTPQAKGQLWLTVDKGGYPSVSLIDAGGKESVGAAIRKEKIDPVPAASPTSALTLEIPVVSRSGRALIFIAK